MNRIKDNLTKLSIFVGMLGSIMVLAVVFFIIIRGSGQVLSEHGLSVFSPSEAWRPAEDPAHFGLVPAILASLYVSFLAVFLALILGIPSALFIKFYLAEGLEGIILSLMDMVAGIPSVIFGFIGLNVVVYFFTHELGMAAGQCVLAGGIVLAIMVLPFIISTLVESLSHLSSLYKIPSMSLGLDKETYIYRIILPSIGRSVLLASIIAFGRALGETMAVMMVIGNSPIFPKLLGRAQTIPSLTALEMGNVAYGSTHLSALYLANGVLLLILIGVLLIASYIGRRIEDD